MFDGFYLKRLFTPPQAHGLSKVILSFRSTSVLYFSQPLFLHISQFIMLHRHIMGIHCNHITKTFKDWKKFTFQRSIGHITWL